MIVKSQKVNILFILLILTFVLNWNINQGHHRPWPWTRSVFKVVRKFESISKPFLDETGFPIFRYLDTCWTKYFSNIYFGFWNIFLFIGPLQKNKHGGVFEWSSDWPWSPLTQMELRKLSLERTIYLFDALPLYTFGTSSLDELLLFIIRLTNW